MCFKIGTLSTKLIK